MNTVARWFGLLFPSQDDAEKPVDSRLPPPGRKVVLGEMTEGSERLRERFLNRSSNDREARTPIQDRMQSGDH